MIPPLDANLVREALRTLAAEVTLEELDRPRSHTVLRAQGITGGDAVTALGVYLAGSLAGAVRVDTSLASRFLGAAVDPEAELASRVQSLIGPDNESISEAFRETRRDPWIAEGIGHMLLMLASRGAPSCVAGRVAALKPMHPRATQQGLDLVAIYLNDASAPFLLVGEGKATVANASAQLTEAAAFFRRIENHERDADLVGDLLILEAALTEPVRSQIGESLWLDQRTFIPLVVYQVAITLETERPTLAGLRLPRDHKRLVVFELPTYPVFFDAVSDAVRAATSDLFASV